MKRSPFLRTAVTGLLAAGLLSAGGALAVPGEDSTRFFLRQEACDSAGYLSTISGDDGADGCSWYGLPLDEVVYQAEGQVLLPLVYTTKDGVPLDLDGARDVTGVVSSRSVADPVGGVGEVVIDVELVGAFLKPDGKRGSRALGSGTFTATALPTEPTTSVPFTLDVPDDATGTSFTGFTLTANIRGANVAASGQGLSGSSYVDLPIVVEQAEGSAGEG